MANLIYQITVKDSSSNTQKTYDVCLPKDIAQLFSLSGSNSTNLTIGSLKHLNLEPLAHSGSTAGGDIQLKAGGCIKFFSHHQEDTNEVMLKVLNGDENAIRWRVNTPELIFTQKNAIDDDGNAATSEFNLRFYRGVVDTKAAATRSNPFHSYLKVRARAIDLRCEEHGGIALQPKGTDSNGNMNKIKFEHGGGDGLEFGTFNAEKTSIFTDEYRFNKDGVWKMATREKETSDKADANDSTTAYKYKKNETTLDGYEEADDFYDYIKTTDPQTTTKDVIKTSYALNSCRGIHTKITDSGNLEIKTFVTYHWAYVSADTSDITAEDHILTAGTSQCTDQLPSGLNKIAGWYSASDFTSDEVVYVTGDNYAIGGKKYTWTEVASPDIKLESDNDFSIDAEDDIELKASDNVKLEGSSIKLEAEESGIDFSTTPSLTFLSKKFTKGCNVEETDAPVAIKSGILNNSRKTVYFDSSNNLFKFPADVLYTDEAHTTLYDVSNPALSAPLYFEDGTRVDADTKYFVIGTEGDVYCVETKGSEGSSKKSAPTCVATGANSGQTYTRIVKTAASGDDPAEYYYPDTVFVAPTYTAASGESTLASGEMAQSSDGSFTLTDLSNLITYAKGQGWIS